MLSVNTNVASLTARRNLGGSQKMMKQSLERLSSGLRINRAADDAAGLAISTGMTSQINGMNQAVRNAGDGISLLNTAEGAIVEQTNILQRMRVLAVQASNGTNSAENRATLQNEIVQLREEMTRIGDTVNFNGKNLMDGSFQDINLQVGAEAGESLSISIDDMRAVSLGGSTLGATVTAEGTAQATSDDLYINGKRIETAADDTSAVSNTYSAKAYVDAINGAGAGVTAKVNELVVDSAGTSDLDAADHTIAAGSLKINGVNIFDEAVNTTSDDASSWSAVTGAINDKTHLTGVSASVDDTGAVELKTVNGENIEVSSTAAAATDLFGNGNTTDVATYTISSNNDIRISGAAAADGGFGESASLTKAAAAAITTAGELESGDLVINGVEITGRYADGGDLVGLINSQMTGMGVKAHDDNTTNLTEVVIYDSTLEITGNKAAALGLAVSTDDASGTFAAQGEGTLNIADISVETAEDASSAIQAIDAALDQVSENRSKLGAMTNRLESTISNLQTVSENLSASRSQILDADFATETAEMTKNQILQQAGVAILAQANMLPQQALSLLG